MNKPQQHNFMRLASVAAGAVAVAVSATTYAATTGTVFQVQASVAKQCSVTALDLNFGAVNPLGADVDQSTTLTVKCTKNTTYNVGLDAGVSTGATIADRVMANGADLMHYQLYKDAGRSAVWGNTSPSWASGTGAGMGTGQPLTVYGRVPTGQTDLAAGNFAEPTITVTVTY